MCDDGEWKLNEAEVVGEGDKIEQGDCISAIAVWKGVYWKDIWNDQANADLKKIRDHPNILLPGDRVTIPEKEEKEESKEDKQRHRMKAKGVPCILRLRFTRFGQPRRGDAYRIFAYPRYEGGKLDDTGAFEAKIWPSAREAEVWLGKDKENFTEVLQFKFGRIGPKNELIGVQSRLWNLNYYYGELSNDVKKSSEETVRAFLRFLQKNNIEGAGEKGMKELTEIWDGWDADDQEKHIQKLVKAHGC